VLFNEPKLLKSAIRILKPKLCTCFSALQRAEIAEIKIVFNETELWSPSFSALQRAEIAEISAKTIRFQDASAFQCSSTSRNC